MENNVDIEYMQQVNTWISENIDNISLEDALVYYQAALQFFRVVEEIYKKYNSMVFTIPNPNKLL